MAVKFERQHFNAIAKILRTELKRLNELKREMDSTAQIVIDGQISEVRNLRSALADYFEQGNELFDRQQFIDAVNREDTHDA